MRVSAGVAAAAAAAAAAAEAEAAEAEAAEAEAAVEAGFGWWCGGSSAGSCGGSRLMPSSCSRRSLMPAHSASSSRIQRI